MTFPHGSPSSLRAVTSNRFNIAIVSNGQDPINLFSDAIYAKCSDPRDKIFALLGLFPHVLSQKIQPRYIQSAREVYREAVIAYVECSGSLDFLSLTGPSWIPDWSVQRRVFTTLGRHCSSNSTVEVTHVAPDILVATGISFDTVEAVTNPLPDDDSKILEMVWDLWLKGTSRSQMYPTGDPLADACAWTLNTGRLADRWPKESSTRTTMAGARLLFQQLQEGGDVSLASGARLEKAVVAVGSTLFKTAKGFLGMSLQEVKVGDRVSILLGCAMPTILRTQPEGRQLFVACVYVHGLMDGEALLGPIPKGWKVVTGYDRNGDYLQQFVNSKTDKGTPLDPRLGPLSADWEPVIKPDRLWPTKKVDGFKNITTGQILHSDPRLLPDALRTRGVPVEKFALV